ncbi:MerR family transcriptional regulator [Weissella kandleri]|uniref:MerR family transcriptional regulator n=1 Tax=Weissella kandleri TaxID=1616 RepID=UPI00387ED870
MHQVHGLKSDLAILTIGAACQLTGLSARQIRYYEQQGLVQPKRGSGNQRRYSLKHITRILEIADYLDMGYSFAEIAEVEVRQQQKPQQDVSQKVVRKSLENEFMQIGRMKR